MKQFSNVILITVDGLRADHLKNAPNILALVPESAVFSRAFATGSSTPYSFPAILTSTYGTDYQGPQEIKRPRVLLPELFQEQGYVTAAFHSNPFTSDFFGYNQGWDYFEDITLASGRLEKKNKLRDFLREAIKQTLFDISPRLFFKLKYRLAEKNVGRLKIKAEKINSLARDFLLAQKNNHFFLWLHYMDVHGPYFSKENYQNNKPYSFDEAVAGSYVNYLNDYPNNQRLRNFLQGFEQKTRELYGQGIECLDEKLGELFSLLKKEGLWENTLLVLTSDHGEELFEHGGVSHFSCKLYQEMLQVPLLIKRPGFPKEVIERKVSLIDLASTICALTGLNPAPSFKGKNLFENRESLPIFHQSGSHFKEKKLTAKIKKYNIACQTNDLKYILDRVHNKEELYNLKLDPEEKNNLASSRPQVVSAMKELVEKFERENPAFSII